MANPVHAAGWPNVGKDQAVQQAVQHCTTSKALLRRVQHKQGYLQLRKECGRQGVKLRGSRELNLRLVGALLRVTQPGRRVLPGSRHVGRPMK